MNLTAFFSDQDLLSHITGRYLDLTSLLRLSINRHYRDVIFSNDWWEKMFGYVETFGRAVNTMYRLVLIDQVRRRKRDKALSFQIWLLGV